MNPEREAYTLSSYTTPASMGLPTVEDPGKAYAQITRGEYMDFKENYGDFENQLIQQAQTDTSLIDDARTDTAEASALMQGVTERQAERYGAALTPAQIREQQRALQRGSTLGSVQALGDARIAQREANTALLSDLINIGQGVNRASQGQLGSAAADQTRRKNAYTQAKAQSKQATYGAVGTLASAAIMAFAF